MDVAEKHPNIEQHLVEEVAAQDDPACD